MVSNYIGIFAQKYLQNAIIPPQTCLTFDVIKLLVLLTDHDFQPQIFIKMMSKLQIRSF